MASDREAEGAELHTIDATAKTVNAKIRPPSAAQRLRGDSPPAGGTHCDERTE